MLADLIIGAKFMLSDLLQLLKLIGIFTVPIAGVAIAGIMLVARLRKSRA